MSQALTYLYQIYSAFLDIVFNEFEISTNVTIGWIAMSIMVMSMMIASILNRPLLPSSKSSGKVKSSGKTKKGK